jgi:hypothetical protein
MSVDELEPPPESPVYCTKRNETKYRGPARGGGGGRRRGNYRNEVTVSYNNKASKSLSLV